MKDISGRVIIITGASSGIGRATAIALARERARLVLAARREKLLLSLADEIQKAGAVALPLALRYRGRKGYAVWQSPDR